MKLGSVQKSRRKRKLKVKQIRGREGFVPAYMLTDAQAQNQFKL